MPSDESAPVRNIANEFQARMVAYAQALSVEARKQTTTQLQLMDEVSEAGVGQNHDQMVIMHLREQSAFLKGFEFSVHTHTEMNKPPNMSASRVFSL